MRISDWSSDVCSSDLVEQIQGDLHAGFNAKLTSLLPTFDLFGYPGLADPGLVTETSFDVDKLLNDHTKVRYVGVHGVTLPETYNGLGVRNLVYMLLQLQNGRASCRERVCQYV